MTNSSTPFDPRTIERPDPALLTYYIWVSLLTLFGFPFVFLAHYIRFRTLRYRFDDEGISMSWGLLFKREVLLTYRRIQDIHVSRNLFERWLGLSSVSIQTASGTAGAEMTLVGITDADRLRDYLYTRMRGARGESPDSAAPVELAPEDELLTLLRDILDGIRTLAAERRP